MRPQKATRLAGDGDDADDDGGDGGDGEDVDDDGDGNGDDVTVAHWHLCTMHCNGSCLLSREASYTINCDLSSSPQVHAL